MPIASISFAADGLISSLYSATFSKIANQRLEGNATLSLPLIERFEVLGVFGQSTLTASLTMSEIERSVAAAFKRSAW